MSTQRRAHVRHSRTNPTHPRLHGNSDTVTLVATWRGQLLICTVVLAIGAVYFVVREPIRQWRQRQRERQSRAVSEELLAADQGRDDPDRGVASHGSSSALAKGQTARERGREKRKEKKRLTTTTGLTSSSGTSAVTSPGPSSPSLPPEATNDASGPSQTQPATVSPVIDLRMSPPLAPVQECEPSSLLLSPQVVDLDSASEAGDMCPDPTRPTHSRATSASVAHDEPLSASSTGRKKKRKSKARSNGHAADLKVTLPRNLNLSSDEVASHASGTSSTPNSPRRRRKTSIAGMPMSPALELLIDNHERTIDSLRAEIGQCKAEEGKARDDEARAREELRRSRATEDRMRAEAERARKARDRADADMRRMEAEIMLLRNRFDTLQHMYQGVCHRLRDYEHPETRNSPRPPLSPAIGSPMVGYPSPMPSPMSAFGQYNHPGHASMYPSPIQTHAFPPPNFVLAPLPHRRGEGSGGGSSEHLAGPLTPGHATSSTQSQASSPYPSDLSLHQSTATPASSATGASDLSAAELRRLNIASSVLKKKTRVATATSESGESHRVSEPADVSEDLAVEGLGIKQLETMPSSAFPSVNGTHSSPASPTSSKQASASPRAPTKKASTDSISSDASSGARGQQLLITPSDTGPKHGLKDAVAFTVDTDATTTPSAGGAGDCVKHFSLNDDDHDDGGGVSNVDAACAEYVPMYASLAHTPEQLAEIARLRETALRDRERRTRV